MAATNEPNRAPDSSRWVEEHGDALYRYALLRVSNPDLAGDLVQDTFLSALKGAANFRGGSTVRTWLIGILKHKIIDYYRRNQSEVLAADLSPTDDDDLGPVERASDRWSEAPSQLVENEEFWGIFNRCLSGLPEAHRRAFSLREFDGIPGEEICNILGVTPSNLWVILHRARAKLKKCLEINWFETKSQ